jgi:integron integrase
MILYKKTVLSREVKVDTPASRRSPRLLEVLVERLRYMHYSLRTEEAYVYWVRSFIRWSGMRHPRDLGAEHVQAFLSMLANERRVSASTHRQALSALLFLYREVIGVDMPWMLELGRPVPRKRLPVVLTHAEVQAVLSRMSGVSSLLGRLLYGTGMRLLEGVRLRVKDVDFARQIIIVRDGKGGKDRVVMLPRVLDAALREQLDVARRCWLGDREREVCGVYLPHALAAKYVRAAESWSWFWVFPSPVLSLDPRADVSTRRRRGSDGGGDDDHGGGGGPGGGGGERDPEGADQRRRHHLHEKRLQRDLKAAVDASGIAKPATVHTLRHYSESMNMPRQPCRWSRAASSSMGNSLGIFSPATLCGVTGDDRDPDIRGSTANGGKWLVPGVGAAPCRADACSRIRTGFGEERDSPCAGLCELARPARDLRPNCRGQAR